MSLSIRGIGTAVPSHDVGQPQAAQIAKTFVFDDPETANVLPMLYRMTQVKRRSSVVLEASSNGQIHQSFYQPAVSSEDRGPSTAARMQRFGAEATQLTEQACVSALQQADVEPDQISHLVTVSCTGFDAPGIDIQLIKRIGLRPEIGRINVGFMGCHGAMNGLRTTKAIVEADPSARVLMCCSELCSLHYYYGRDPEKLVANALFADGAAAIVGVPENIGELSDWSVNSCGSYLLPDCEDLMTWKIGDHGFEMTLSPRVPSLIHQFLPAWIDSWLEPFQLSTAAIRSWAIHPGGPRIIQSVAKSLGLDDALVQPSVDVLGQYGNMSSATILFVMQHLQLQGAETPCVALAFGPGLTAEAVLIRSPAERTA